MRNTIIVAFLVIVGGVVWFSSAHKTAPGLEAFEKITKEDPLLYSPFMDDDFGGAVDEIAFSEKRLRDTVIGTIENRKDKRFSEYVGILREYELFPSRFLGMLPDVATLTEDFLDDPDSNKAKKLLDTYEEAADAYIDSASSTLDAFAKIEAQAPTTDPLYYFFIESGTSQEIVQKDFEKIYKNGLELKEEIARRRRCLLENRDCDIREIVRNREDVSNEIQKVDDTDPNVTMIKEHLPFIRIEQEIRGPYLAPSSCWRGSPHSLYAVYGSIDDKRVFIPKLVDESYFRILSPTDRDLISVRLRERGLSFYSQPEAVTYECTDLTFYPRVMTLDFLDTHDIATTSAEYESLMGNQFGVIAPALNSLALFTDILEMSQRVESNFVISPGFLHTTRSAYSLLYMPYAQSVWRIEDRLTYMMTEKELIAMQVRFPFLRLSELQKAGYSEKEIKDSFINQKEFLESIVN